MLDVAAPKLATVALLTADPELAKHLSPQDFRSASRVLAAPVVTIERGEFEPQTAFAAGHGCFAGLVLSGLLGREVAVEGQPTLELLGPGDVVHGDDLDACVVNVGHRWSALAPTRVALLDDRFLLAVRRWPRLLTGLVERLQRRQDFASLQLALGQHPRVEDRIHLLLCVLADRWGRVTPAGLVLDLRLSHESIGRMVGARRPTVSLALKALATRGAVQRQDDQSWLLTPFERSTTRKLRFLRDSTIPAPASAATAQPATLRRAS